MKRRMRTGHRMKNELPPATTPANCDKVAGKGSGAPFVAIFQLAWSDNEATESQRMHHLRPASYDMPWQSPMHWFLQFSNVVLGKHLSDVDADRQALSPGKGKQYFPSTRVHPAG